MAEKDIIRYIFPVGLGISAVAALVTGFSVFAGIAVVLGLVAGIMEGLKESSKIKTIWTNIGLLLVGTTFGVVGTAWMIGSIAAPVLQAVGTYLALVAATSLVIGKITSKI